MVERITGRTVVGFVSGIDTERDIASDVFYLAPLTTARPLKTTRRGPRELTVRLAVPLPDGVRQQDDQRHSALRPVSSERWTQCLSVVHEADLLLGDPRDRASLLEVHAVLAAGTLRDPAPEGSAQKFHRVIELRESVILDLGLL